MLDGIDLCGVIVVVGEVDCVDGEFG